MIAPVRTSSGRNVFNANLRRSALIVFCAVGACGLPCGTSLAQSVTGDSAASSSPTVSSEQSAGRPGVSDTLPNNPKETRPPDTTERLVTRGTVIRDQVFSWQIGARLFFHLVPSGLGWTMSVSSTEGVASGSEDTVAGRNFAGIVTPPYRGMNSLDIEGWHFRNADNSGPNSADSLGVNAPQMTRGFGFVLNDSDYLKALAALQTMLWPGSATEDELVEASRIHNAIIKGEGTLVIRRLWLNNLVPGKQAGIDSMIFDVEIRLP